MSKITETLVLLWENQDCDLVSESLVLHFKNHDRWMWRDVADEALRVYNMMFAENAQPHSPLDCLLTNVAAAAAEGVFAAIAAAIGVKSADLECAVSRWYDGQDMAAPALGLERLRQMLPTKADPSWEHVVLGRLYHERIMHRFQAASAPLLDVPASPVMETTLIPEFEVAANLAVEATLTPAFEVIETPVVEATLTSAFEVIESPVVEATLTPAFEVTETPVVEANLTPACGAAASPVVEGTLIAALEATATPVGDATSNPSVGATVSPSVETNLIPVADAIKPAIDPTGTVELTKGDTGWVWLQAVG